ncbi:ornithine cyclodeaminase [Sphingobium sp. OAS761]|uniref:ornithine cyclodeaminase family protein n=1 Tax=Sphingobium sp. OAS761 TaxID=2817901 RepID=UPI00209F5117|nr:ornithine cyclodeaminase family protein [Sphingobium sp. OAS761]MCP1469773.1 ornithine cyclodeaminase [Sphingobium sp. OAS761]
MAQADPTIPFYDASRVRALLDYDGCIAAVRAAMRDFTAGGTEQPLRTIIPIAPGELFALMPGMLESPHGFGAKVITAYGDPDRPGRSAHRGVVVLFDRADGRIVCIADAGEITHIRTAAASAVATEALARPDACRLAMFGCGAQGWTHVQAIARVRALKEIIIWARDEDAAHAFAARVETATGIPARAAPDGRTAAGGADIICTVTASQTPVLLGDWVRPGTHVNIVGSSHAGPVEIDHDLVLRSRFIADSRRSVLAAGAEFLNAKAAGLIDDGHIVAEIGEVLLRQVPGRCSEQDITVYKSLGHVVQDLAAAAYVHQTEKSIRY